MGRREDFIRAINLEEPERVPLGELSIDPPHIEKLMCPARFWSPEDRPAAERIELFKHNAEVQVRCYDKLGMSLVVCNVALHPARGWSAHVLSRDEAEDLREETGLRYTAGTFVDEWSRGMVFDADSKVWIQQYGTMSTMADWEQWADSEDCPLNTPYAEGRDEDAKIVIELAEKCDMAVAGLLRAPSATLFECFPVGVYYRLQLEQPEFINRAVEAYTEYNVKMVEVYADLGCDLVISTGDLAHTDGPLMRPELFDEFYFPPLRREVEAAHAAGIKYAKHTDGDVRSLLPGLVHVAKVDGVHSLDPSAGVDIGEIKAEFGDVIFLMGNISVDHLALKSEAEIVQEAKQILRKAAPGGGFVFCSSNSWYSHCKLRNCLAYVRAVQEYGQYPITVE